MPVMIKVNDDIADLTADGFAVGQVPVWSGSSFEPGSGGPSDIADLSALGFDAGDIPYWDGAKLVPFDNYQKKFTRVVTVHPDAGVADYTTVGAACAYILTQVHDVNHRWLIIVHGKCFENPFTIPNYTQITSPAPAPYASSYAQISFDNAVVTSGTLITLEGSGTYNAIIGVAVNYIKYSTVQTGDLVMFQLGTSGAGGFQVFNCTINFQVSYETYNNAVFAPYPGSTSNQSFTAYYCVIVLSNLGSGKAGIVNTESNYCYYGLYWCWVAASEILKTGSSIVPLIFSCFIRADEFITTGTVTIRGESTLQSKSGGQPTFTGNWVFDNRNVRHTGQGIWVAGAADISPVVGKGALSQSADLIKGLDSNAAVQWAVGPAGEMKTNQVIPATVASGLVGVYPIYDSAGSLEGYVPVYSGYAE